MKSDTEKVSMSVNMEITKYLLENEENVYERSYGPFTVEIPKGLSTRDIYKFALYTLRKIDTVQSGEYITKIGTKITNLDKKHFKHHKMGGLKLESYLLNKQRPIKSHGVNTCVIDYVWDQVRGRRGFRTYTYDKLKSEIYDYVPEGDMINTEELINWTRNCHDNVSIHAFDCRYRKFITHIGKANRYVSLVYIVKDHHCYPITDEKLKIVASKANQGGCKDLLKHMADLSWTRRHENVTKIKSIEEIINMSKENHIVILPEGVKMKDAVELYSKNENVYVEYLHWNNNSILDGFIDHNKNMYLLNEEYDKRKKICNKLFDIYKTHDFIWTNQSYTSIATSLF